MIEFNEYSDDQIRIKLPKQLRQQRSQRLFRGNLIRGKHHSNVMVAVDLDLNSQRIEAHQRVFRDSIEKHPENQPQGVKVHRSGPCSFGEDGSELLTSTNILDKGYTLHRWDLLYRLQERYIMLIIMGGGSQEEFESMARVVITSLALQSSTQPSKPASVTIKKENRGGMRAKDKARLTKALASLPESLMYLREPVLALADEDQDMLGTGDVDSKLLAELIEKQVATQGPEFASFHAEILEQWAEKNKLREKVWASPIWFTQAFLMGFDAFGNQ